MRRRLHACALRLEPQANDPHPCRHDALVHLGRLLCRKVVPAVACVGDSRGWRRRPEQCCRGDWQGQCGGGHGADTQSEQLKCRGYPAAAQGEWCPVCQRRGPEAEVETAECAFIYDYLERMLTGVGHWYFFHSASSPVKASACLEYFHTDFSLLPMLEKSSIKQY